MIEKLPTKKYIGATEVRNKLGRLLNRVHRREAHLVVEKLGIPVAAISQYRGLRALSALACSRVPSEVRQEAR